MYELLIEAGLLTISRLSGAPPAVQHVATDDGARLPADDRASVVTSVRRFTWRKDRRAGGAAATVDYVPSLWRWGWRGGEGERETVKAH